MANDVVWVDSTRLQNFSPLDIAFWTGDAVTENDVYNAVMSGRTRSTPIAFESDDYNSVMAHAERVAYFVVNGIPDGEAIEIDVGIPSMGYHARTVSDGNHRLAAALIRKDGAIPCTISGSIDEIERLFDIAL